MAKNPKHPAVQLDLLTGQLSEPVWTPIGVGTWECRRCHKITTKAWVAGRRCRDCLKAARTAAAKLAGGAA